MLELAEYITNELGAEEQTKLETTGTETASPESVTPEVVHAVAAPVERILFTVEGTDYAKTRSGLYLLVQVGNNTVDKFISGPVVIEAEARDSSSSNWGKVIRFDDRDGVAKRLFIRNSDIVTNGKAIVIAMSNEGLHISSESRMIDYLLRYLNLGTPCDDKRAICTDRIGWHGDVYLFYDNSSIGNADTRVVYTGAPIGNNHATKGTLEEWRDNVAAICKGNSLLILAVCVSFASVLLRLLKVESCGYHFYGESSTGKSTTLYVAASVHGEPDSMFGSWNTTVAGMEARSKKYTDSLMINDELHESNPKDAGKIIYMIMNGKGRQRSNVLGDARDVAEWRLNCLSSGEVSSEDFIRSNGGNSRVGHTVRLVDISADMGRGLGAFEMTHGEKSSHDFAERIKNASLTYYGTPIRAFIEGLIGHYDQLVADFVRIKEEFFGYYVPENSDGQVKRVATKFVVAALAGEISGKMGITGWSDDISFNAVSEAFERWLAVRGTTGPMEAEKAVDQVKNFLRSHGMSRFIPVKKQANGRFVVEYPDRQYTINNMAGFRLTNNGNANEFLVFPEAYKNEICLGLNAQLVTSTCVNRKYLIHDEGDKKPQARRRMPGMEQARYYHFNSSILSDAEESVSAESNTEVQ